MNSLSQNGSPWIDRDYNQLGYLHLAFFGFLFEFTPAKFKTSCELQQGEGDGPSPRPKQRMRRPLTPAPPWRCSQRGRRGRRGRPRGEEGEAPFLPRFISLRILSLRLLISLILLVEKGHTEGSMQCILEYFTLLIRICMIQNNQQKSIALTERQPLYYSTARTRPTTTFD